MSELDQAFLRAREAFLPLDGVVGVGYGPKLRGGKVVAPQAIVVFVERKLPAGAIAPEQLVPPTFAELPTDVRVPQLTPATRRGPGEAPAGQEDLCLTDYQWIDWPKIHRRRAKSQRPGGPGPG